MNEIKRQMTNWEQRCTINERQRVLKIYGALTTQLVKLLNIVKKKVREPSKYFKTYKKNSSLLVHEKNVYKIPVPMFTLMKFQKER